MGTVCFERTHKQHYVMCWHPYPFWSKTEENNRSAVCVCVRVCILSNPTPLMGHLVLGC